jgi:hypothetical protein
MQARYYRALTFIFTPAFSLASPSLPLPDFFFVSASSLSWLDVIDFAFCAVRSATFCPLFFLMFFVKPAGLLYVASLLVLVLSRPVRQEPCLLQDAVRSLFLSILAALIPRHSCR